MHEAEVTPQRPDDWVPLSAEDRAILALESPTIAGHTCKVIHLTEAAPDLAQLRARIAERIHLAPAQGPAIPSSRSRITWSSIMTTIRSTLPGCATAWRLCSSSGWTGIGRC